MSWTLHCILWVKFHVCFFLNEQKYQEHQEAIFPCKDHIYDKSSWAEFPCDLHIFVVFCKKKKMDPSCMLTHWGHHYFLVTDFADDFACIFHFIAVGIVLFFFFMIFFSFFWFILLLSHRKLYKPNLSFWWIRDGKCKDIFLNVLLLCDIFRFGFLKISLF